MVPSSPSMTVEVSKDSQHDTFGFDGTHSTESNSRPLGAFTSFLGNGIQGHVRRWKRDVTRKKLEDHLVIVQQARTGSKETSQSQALQSLGLGDFAVTLFSPLDGPFESVVGNNTNDNVVSFEMVPEHSGMDELNVETDETPDATTATAEESSDEDDNVFYYDDGSELDSPLLLTVDMMRQLRQAMPSSTQLKFWKRLYSLARDGDVFQTFLSAVSGHQQTLLVIQTSTGEVFGGFAEAHWGKLAMRTDGAYHGTGRSFLFSVTTEEHSFQGQLAGSPSTVILSNDESCAIGDVTIHPWQGVNEYSILCSTRDGGRLAMGGGAVHGTKSASFGFCVEHHFCKGSSGACATFGNKRPLSSTDHYDIVGFEVYGFVHGW